MPLVENYVTYHVVYTPVYFVGRVLESVWLYFHSINQADEIVTRMNCSSQQYTSVLKIYRVLMNTGNDH